MEEESSKTGWEHFEHKADIGIRGTGSNLAEAFEQAAIALTAVITEPENIELSEKIEISCADDDVEILLVDWLNKLIYEMDTRKMLFGKFEVSIEEKHLTATVWGEKTDVSKHQPAVEVKGATYTELKVWQDTEGNWIAQCVVDV